MLRRVVLVKTDVSEEHIVSVIGQKYYIVFLRSVIRLVVTANVPSSPILATLMMEAIHSSE
jgi:hypothetical protein